MSDPTEIELKFLVPAAARATLAAEMLRSTATTARVSLAAMYLDTPDRRLGREGIAWRLRREGRRWVQALKAGGANPLERFEHEVVRPTADADASLHAGTSVGDRLIALLAQAHADGVEPGVRFGTEVRRTLRQVRTRGAVVEVAFDQGHLVAGTSRETIREIEFELVSGSVTAMLALTERWRQRFGLIFDPRSKAERGDRLTQGSPFAAVRKAKRLDYAANATATQALAAVVDECLAQITRNAIGLIEGDPARRVEHVHQARVGIRRLRSALQCFDGWAPAPPNEIVEGLRGVFNTLGLSRDHEVSGAGIAAQLARAGAPPLTHAPGGAAPDPVAAIRASGTQQNLLAWIVWRTTLNDTTADTQTDGRIDADGAADGAATTSFHRDLERRLRRWHRRIVADQSHFDDLDEPRLHALRKRIKRQRYAVEFFEPVLRPQQVKRYLKALARIQDRMGELNDLFVARALYQPLVASEPAAWFALGWLAARITAVRSLAKPELKRLAAVDPPRSRPTR